MVFAAIEQFALRVCEVEERCAMRFDVTQRHHIEIDVGDSAVLDRHAVAQDAFCLHPVVFGCFGHDHEQVIGCGVAVGRAACEPAEEQDVGGVEIAVGEAVHDPRGFAGVVKPFGLRDGLRGRLFRNGNGLLAGLNGYGCFVDNGLRRLFLHGVLIRFHFSCLLII